MVRRGGVGGVEGVEETASDEGISESEKPRINDVIPYETVGPVYIKSRLDHTLFIQTHILFDPFYRKSFAPHQSSMSSNSSTTTTSSSLTQDAFLYITTLVRECQHRGGYTLDEAVALHRALANISPASSFSASSSSSSSSTSPSFSAIHVMFQLLNKSQSLGKLSLKEAWTVYNAQEVLLVSSEEARGKENDKTIADNAETVDT